MTYRSNSISNTKFLSKNDSEGKLEEKEIIGIHFYNLNLNISVQ